jgi:hypothetical protein
VRAAAFFGFVSECPPVDAIGDLGLAIPVQSDSGRGKDAAIVVATGLRAIFVDGAFAIDQHEALSLVTVNHDEMALGPAKARESAVRGGYGGWFGFRQGGDG